MTSSDQRRKALRISLTPKRLTAKEDAILDRLEYTQHDKTFLGKLYRDGVPSPPLYLAQPVRVLFVFREPNLGGKAYALDMRDQIRDRYFRPLLNGRRDVKTVSTSWWNAKAGLFAHAVAAALEGNGHRPSFSNFKAVIDSGEWHHEVVNRFAYIQIKKLGGRGTCDVQEIRSFAMRYCETLREQIDLYQPHLIIGCGLGRASPSRLLLSHVLHGGKEKKVTATGATWWSFPKPSLPFAMVQLYHPSERKHRATTLYADVWKSIDEIVREIGVANRFRDG